MVTKTRRACVPIQYDRGGGNAPPVRYDVPCCDCEEAAEGRCGLLNLRDQLIDQLKNPFGHPNHLTTLIATLLGVWACGSWILCPTPNQHRTTNRVTDGRSIIPDLPTTYAHTIHTQGTHHHPIPRSSSSSSSLHKPMAGAARGGMERLEATIIRSGLLKTNANLNRPQPSLFYLPGLTARPFHNPKRFPWVQT